MAEEMPGTTSKGTPRLLERLDLLPAPAKYKGVAPLQTDHRVPLLGQGDEQTGRSPPGGRSGIPSRFPM